LGFNPSRHLKFKIAELLTKSFVPQLLSGLNLDNENHIDFSFVKIYMLYLLYIFGLKLEQIAVICDFKIA